MKRLGLLILLTVPMLMLMQGCGKSGVPETNTGTIQTDTGTVQTDTGTKDNTSTPKSDAYDDYIVTDAGNGSRILYKAEHEQVLKIVLKSGEEKVICNDLPSQPSISPDGKRVAYLSPFEWEIISNVHIYDIDKDTDATVLSVQESADNKNVREQTTPKSLTWLDDRYLLMVIQFAYGTVTKGGDLYVYDTQEDSLQPLTKLFRQEEITGVKVEQDTVYLDFIEFTTESMDAFKELKRAVEAEQIYDAIRSGNLISHFILVDDLERIKALENGREKYEFNEKNPYKEELVDLNGDGKTDDIKLQIAGEYGNYYILKVNDLEIKGSGDNLDKKLYIVDIDKLDSFKEIAVQEFGPSDDYRTYFYSYNGNELRFMGDLGGLSTEKERIGGDGKVASIERLSMLQTWFMEKEYKLDVNHLLEVIKNDLYPVAYVVEPLKLKVELKLFDGPKSKNTAAQLKAGDIIKLLGSDGIEWCYAETSAGVKGWFAVDGFTVRENGLDTGDVFDGLSMAD